MTEPATPSLETIAIFRLCAEYSRRYQEILLQLPYTLLDGTVKTLTKDNRVQTAGAIHAYVDLCAEQEFVRAAGLIPDLVWNNWLEGMRHNFSLPLIKSAWDELKAADRYARLLAVLEPESDSSATPHTQDSGPASDAETS